MWPKIWSKAGVEKLSNWNSATGTIPPMERPTKMPPMLSSARGVSKTLSGPNSSCSPRVTWKTPPFFPTSSPNITTLLSRRMPSRRAMFTAFLMFTPGLPPAISGSGSSGATSRCPPNASARSSIRSGVGEE